MCASSRLSEYLECVMPTIHPLVFSLPKYVVSWITRIVCVDVLICIVCVDTLSMVVCAYSFTFDV